MNNVSLLSRLHEIEGKDPQEISLNSGFLKGLKIKVDYKDRLAIEAIEYIIEQNGDNTTLQEIVDVANNVVVWLGWLVIMKNNNVGEDDKCHTKKE